jgi:hypothetical protein
VTAPQVPADLSEATRLMGAADRALYAWRNPMASDPGDQIRGGHDCVARIDALTRELHAQRALLVDELAEDEIERAIKVDRMLKGLREERAKKPGPLFTEDGAVSAFMRKYLPEGGVL